MLQRKGDWIILTDAYDKLVAYNLTGSSMEPSGRNGCMTRIKLANGEVVSVSHTIDVILGLS